MNAGEVLSYNMAQRSALPSCRSDGHIVGGLFTWRSEHRTSLVRICLAIGQGSQIQTGYYIGKGMDR
ncbi:hypothetical protein OH492_05015 [Vibrio chagasii]|nr:hypothetical protein [Vibrio chagasii]